MILWGSVGVFARYIPLTPILLAFSRAVISIPVISIIIFSSKKKLIKNFKLKDIKLLISSGVLIGLAWWALFTAFKYTNISAAILAYNMCPIYVLLLSPRILKEKLKREHIINIVLAVIGLIVIVFPSLNKGGSNFSGILFGIISGLLYSFIVIINRKTSNGTDAISSTFIQMISTSCILLPIVLMENPIIQLSSLNTNGVIMLLILGVLHTGIGFLIYFSSYKALSATSIALLSYLEPVFGIFFGVILLKEQLTVWQVIGGFLILGSTVFEKLGSYKKVSLSALKQ
jgi:RarD protein